MTQAVLADKSGISLRNLSRIELTDKVSFKAARRLAITLNTTAAYLMYDTDDVFLIHAEYPLYFKVRVEVCSDIRSNDHFILEFPQGFSIEKMEKILRSVYAATGNRKHEKTS